MDPTHQNSQAPDQGNAQSREEAWRAQCTTDATRVLRAEYVTAYLRVLSQSRRKNTVCCCRSSASGARAARRPFISSIPRDVTHTSSSWQRPGSIRPPPDARPARGVHLNRGPFA